LKNIRVCVYCDKELTGRQKKYCNKLCRYRYLSIKKDSGTGSLSKAQSLRMVRAGRQQRAGKIGCRYN
jgi:hypothetical protein